MTKKDIRKNCLKTRDAIPEPKRKKYSQIISSKIFDLSLYKNATKVLSYASYRSEVITDDINRQILVDKKRLYLPKTYSDRGEIIFYEVRDLSILKPGYMGIKEPPEDEDLKFHKDATDTDILVIMPGVAFDDAGNRLGYGGGYYDRFLSAWPDLSLCTILLSFSSQKIPEIPCEITDIKPELIISEQCIHTGR